MKLGGAVDVSSDRVNSPPAVDLPCLPRGTNGGQMTGLLVRALYTIFAAALPSPAYDALGSECVVQTMGLLVLSPVLITRWRRVAKIIEYWGLVSFEPSH